jgi:hypothetical protein
MKPRFQFSVRDSLMAMTCLAIGCAAAVFRAPRHWSGHWLDVADFVQLGVVLLTPFAVLAIVFGRPLVWLAVAVVFIGVLFLCLPRIQ